MFRSFSQSNGPRFHGPRDAGCVLSGAFYALCKAVDTPISLGAWLRYRNREFVSLLSMRFDPLNYDTAWDAKGDYLVIEFLSKFKGLETGYNLKAIALGNFKKAEAQCAETNDRLRKWKEGRVTPTVPAVELVIERAQRKIIRLLSDCKPSDALDRCRWGPGSTATLSGRLATRTRKLIEHKLSVSRTAAPLLRGVIASDLHWLRARGIASEGPTYLCPGEFHIRDHAKITTVPKNSKTDRTIGIEPTGNIFLQLGVGSLLRSCLRKVRVDLDDQSTNRRLARLASYDGTLSTIDLSMASDSVSIECVYALLPLDWCLFLDKVRTPKYKIGNEDIAIYQKWSAMGNGYTFELESMIFWALTSAASEIAECKGSVSVYGDDIICPVGCHDLLVATLSFLGFTTNDKKTFRTSWFRESCGGHYFRGVEITPIYQKEDLSTELELIRLANRLSRLVHPQPRKLRGCDVQWNGRRLEVTRPKYETPMIDDPRVLNAWLSVRRSFRTSCFQPLYADGDAGVRVPREEWVLLSHQVPGGRCCLGLKEIGVRRSASNEALLALTLRFGDSSCPSNGKEASRRDVVLRRKRMYYSLELSDRG